jgi:hypothetical protein
LFFTARRRALHGGGRKKAGDGVERVDIRLPRSVRFSPHITRSVGRILFEKRKGKMRKE